MAVALRAISSKKQISIVSMQVHFTNPPIPKFSNSKMIWTKRQI